MKTYKKQIIITSLLILLTLLIGCSQEQSQSETLKGSAENDSSKQAINDNDTMEEKIIRLSGGDSGLPNPFRHVSRGPGISKMHLIYDSLIEKDEEGNIPWLAKDWEISEDGLEYIFFLEEDVFWQDGELLTAEDVKFTFDYYKKHSPVSNALYVHDEYIIESTEVLDALTVKITLNSPNPSYFTDVGFMRIIPKHIWESIEDPKSYDGEGKVIGSGPFVMESYNLQEGTYRYKAFDNYWGLNQKVDYIEWVPVSDTIMAFENEEIDLINVSADLISRYKDDSEFTLISKHSYHSYRLLLNMEKRDELKELNIRQGMAYAIDQQNLIDVVERGSGEIASMGYVPSVHYWYNNNVKDYEYNLEQAKELLEDTQLTFELLTGNSNDEIRIAELIQNDFREVGIELKIESVDNRARDGAVVEGKYELVLINSGGMGSDPSYLSNTYGEGSLPGYYNEEIQQLLIEQDKELDNDKRKELVFQLQELIAEEVPIIMLYGPVDNNVYRHGHYDGWMFRYDHNKATHNKLSYLER
ncbi:peptide/nickel transport system substrate-binding protein [Natranaerovirga hydrolytica]|uniref:Peptide/nickel transport system substrate-binding protein n=1 Tax=Natranaerovirga hydrolytica TaxID=680378 RepID=A0A4R1MAA1_9FIRM|nr:ABC transporter substrate-binding protein [Natranaerovirga hydrolytica]TCK87874.1 peptide/nickel transport system substrate-binding protein [Natranaerovirga hydrolytica]